MTETNAAHTVCNKRWVSRGNRTGHCARCHHSWEGITLFDKHQRILPDGSVECLEGATIEFPKGYPLQQDEYGTWSSTKKFELKEVKK